MADMCRTKQDKAQKQTHHLDASARANKNKSEILQSLFEVHDSKAHDAMQVELTWNKTFTPMELDNGL